MKAGAGRVVSQLGNRLCHLEMEAHLDDWCEWALASGLDVTTISFLRFKPNLLSDFEADRFSNPTPRSWEAVARANVNLPASGALPAGVVAAVKGAKVIDLDANTLAALGNKSPEKWEGLAIGPQLAGGQYLVLAGSDNDYSVTQNGSNTQFDVWFRFSDADPYAGSIQCPVGSTTGCSFTTGGAAATLSGEYSLLPGVLHAYTANIDGYAAPVPEPGSWAMLAGGGLLMGVLARRRRRG